MMPHKTFGPHMFAIQARVCFLVLRIEITDRKKLSIR